MAVTVAPTVEPSTGPQDPPRIRLNVTATAGETATTVTRLNPDGTTTPVRTTDGNPLTISAGVALLYDYEVPLGLPVRYSSVETTGNVSAAVVLPDPSVWLVPIGVPALARPVELAVGSFAEETWDVAAGVHWPMGREYPVTQTDGVRKTPASTLAVQLEDADALADLRSLVRDAGTLYLNVPADLGLGVDSAYIAVGAIRNRRPSNIGTDPLRVLELPYQVVDRPVGGTQAERTLADLAGYGTLAALAAAYPTLFDIAVGP